MNDPYVRLWTRVLVVGTVLALMLVFNYCQVSIKDVGTWAAVVGAITTLDALFIKAGVTGSPIDPK